MEPPAISTAFRASFLLFNNSIKIMFKHNAR